MSKKTLIHIILLATLIAGMALTNISSASAQGIIPENTVSFAQLKVSDITLKGPLGADSIRFSLPADWQMTAGAELHLNFQVFTGDVQSNLPGTINPVAGFLTVRVNDVWVETVTIDHNGEYSVVISIPDTAWITTPPNARQSIRFSLESGQSCDMIQAALQRGIFTGLDTVIHPSSFLVLPHADTTLPLDLTLFPYPLYQRSFTPDTAVLVMPQHPTESELQAAITTAGALGSLTERGLLLTFVTADKLDPSTLNNVHVVFVGKPENLSLLQEAKWPLSLKDGKFSARELRADDGILQIAVSPYSRTKAWLLVSGNTDRGVIKASQAAGTGAIRTGSRPDLAIVSDVNIQSRNITQADLSLQDLGYQNMTLSGFGHQDVFAQFDIPLDFHVANEAYLDLVYSNSSLLDFEEAAITLELNDEFIGGLRLSDRTTNTTTYRFNIPGTSFHSGTNSMTIVASLNSATPCVPGNDIWVSIWSTSLLHVPLEPAAPNEKAASYDLGLYPKKLFPLFNNTTFVLAPNDPLSWTAAAQIAYDLGTYPRGSVINPSVTYPENLSPEARQNNDLLLIGRPTTLSTLELLSPNMPAPFEPGSDIATEPNSEVSFRIPAENPVGYLELFPSPWNIRRVILLVAGNGSEGLNSAVTALTDKERLTYPPLSGNLVMISGTQMLSQQVVLYEPQSIQAVPTTVVPLPAAAIAPKEPINVDLPITAEVLTGGILVLGIIFWLVRRNSSKKEKLADKA